MANCINQRKEEQIVHIDKTTLKSDFFLSVVTAAAANLYVLQSQREWAPASDPRERAPVVLVAHARSHGKRFPTPTLRLGIRILKHKLALQPIAHVIHLRPYD